VDQSGAHTSKLCWRQMDAPTPLPQSATPRSTSSSSNGPGQWDDVSPGNRRLGSESKRAEVHDLMGSTA
jgi:hypothetical protein